MITAPDKSWRYFGPPRTGGTLLHTLLQEPPINGVYSGYQHDIEPLFGARNIVSVRNPFTRAVSLWRHYRYTVGLEENGRHGVDEHIVPITEAEMPFKTFLEQMCSMDDFYHFSLNTWLQDLRRLDHIIHMENFWPDILTAFPCLRTRPEPQPVNTSRAALVFADPYRNPWCADYVRKRWKSDFERFGYPFDVPTDLGL